MNTRPLFERLSTLPADTRVTLMMASGARLFGYVVTFADGLIQLYDKSVHIDESHFVIDSAFIVAFRAEQQL